MVQDLGRPPYEIHLEDNGVLRVRADAALSRENFALYAADLRERARRARLRAGHLTILVDASAGSLLPAETARAVTALQRELLSGPFDRIAVTVANSLQKLQIRRLGIAGKSEAFLSENAARTWLSAYSHLSAA